MLTEEQKQKLRKAGYSDVKIAAYEGIRSKGTRGFFNTTTVGRKAKELGTNVIEAVKDPVNVIPERLKAAVPQEPLVSQNENGEYKLNEGAANELNDFALSFSGGANAGKKLADIVDEPVTRAVMSHPFVSKLQNVKQKITNFFSNDVDDKAKTILGETPVEKFDEYVKVAQEAVTDPRKLTPFEVVGDKISDAAKQLNQQMKSLSEQKRQIISKAKNGLSNFTRETGRVILDVRRSLGDSKVAQDVIQKLKTVKTKVDADRVIDDIQDMLYKGNQDKTIPLGSSDDRMLRGILGRYNNVLKQGLPSAYANLNTKISNRIKAIQSLNRSLGEVVDGVSTRGAGLIKQFFSPSGRKAKELFDFIKKNTGIDLAQDATLARFTMELFDDPRARSLLEGVPRSVSSVIDKVVDFAVDKAGIGRGVQDQIRTNTLNKARGLTK